MVLHVPGPILDLARYEISHRVCPRSQSQSRSHAVFTSSTLTYKDTALMSIEHPLHGLNRKRSRHLTEPWMILSHILSLHKLIVEGLESLPRELSQPWTRLVPSYVDHARLPKRSPSHWTCHFLAILVHYVHQVRGYSLDVDGV